MIQTIVDDCLRDGQFDDCDLTMRDLAIIVETLGRTVSNIYHHRIDYPGFEFNRGASAADGGAIPRGRPGRVRARSAVIVEFGRERRERWLPFPFAASGRCSRKRRGSRGRGWTRSRSSSAVTGAREP